jgi:hypothetical protein
MNWLESLAQPFIWHPARAACVGLAWLGVSLVLPKAARLPLLVAAVGWGVFAALEFEAWRERANIRIDLLVTWPALCILTAGCLALSLKRITGRSVARPDRRPKEFR